MTYPGVYDRAMSTQAEVTAFVLAGGKSTRMGTDKAFVTLDGRTLVARALDVARSVTSDVRIVGEPRRFAAFAPVVEDEFPGCGPLGGIHAALRSSGLRFECDCRGGLAVYHSGAVAVSDRPSERFSGSGDRPENCPRMAAAVRDLPARVCESGGHGVARRTVQG